MEPSLGTGTADDPTKGRVSARTLTAVICTTGTRPSLVAAERSLEGDLRPGDELLVLRDAAESIAVLRQRALLDAAHELVAFVDDDEIVRPGWRDAMVTALSSAGVGAVGGRTIARWPDGAAPPWLHRGLLPSFGVRQTAGAHPPFAGNLGVRRGAALSVGGFRSDLGHRGTRTGLHEETDLCRRLADAGWFVVDAPNAVVEHEIRPEQTTRRWTWQRSWHEGISDAVMDGSEARGAAIHAAKLAGLVAITPIAAARPTTRTFVVARALVNLGFLRETLATRIRRRFDTVG
jgi:succinoglycan biosynthesis protein ExoM